MPLGWRCQEAGQAKGPLMFQGEAKQVPLNHGVHTALLPGARHPGCVRVCMHTFGCAPRPGSPQLWGSGTLRTPGQPNSKSLPRPQSPSQGARVSVQHPPLPMNGVAASALGLEDLVCKMARRALLEGLHLSLPRRAPTVLLTLISRDDATCSRSHR